MKAIVVKYLGPTNHKGSRFRVTAEGLPAMTVPYNHGAHEPEVEAAHMFCAKHRWAGELAKGRLPTGEHVFVFVNQR